MLHRRAARHVRRGAHHVLRWIGAVAAVAILVVLVAIWRLMQGPIELDWLTPYVEAAIDRSGLGVKLAISGVRVGIDRNTRQLQLRTENVRLSLPDGAPLASFPELVTSFPVGQLLRGRTVPAQIAVERPVLHLTRDAAGAIAARIGAGDQSPAELGPQWLEELAAAPSRDSRFAPLRRVSIRQATVIVDDRATGQTWHAERVDIAAERSAKGLRGDVSLAMPLGGSAPELHVGYRYLAERQLLDLDMAIEGVRPAALPPLIPELAQLRHVDAPISGTLRTRIDLQRGTAQGSRLDLALGQGRIESQWLPEGGIAVDQGELHATYAPESDEIRVEQMLVDLGGGAALVVNGTLAGVTPELIAAPADARPAGHVTGKFGAALRNIATARFASLWPAAFSPGGRRWTLANIHDGVLDDASVDLAVDLDPVSHTANFLSAEGRLRYHDVTVTYLRGLPPVRKVNGTAVFANNQLEFTPTGGTLKTLKVTGGSLRLTNLGAPTEWLTIDLAITGPLSDALDVLDTKPLQYAHAMRLDPARVGGHAETQLHFKLPLLDELKLDAIDYNAKATITGASIANVALDKPLRDADLNLDLTRTGAHLRGTARFDDIPAKIDAEVMFHPKSGPHSLYRVGMKLDEAAQRRLGFEVGTDRLDGPIALDATYSGFAANKGEVTALLDMRAAALAIPEAGWKKPTGQPAAAKLVLDLDNDRIARIRSIEASAAGLQARLSAQMAADGSRLERVDLIRLAVGGSDVSGTVTRRPAGGWRADIHALRIDAHHLLKEAIGGAPSPASPPLAVNARVDRLVLGSGRELHDVTAELLRTAGSWETGRIDGRYPNGHQLSLRFGEDGSRRLEVQSDDLGASLKLLDIADNVVGGQMKLNGQFIDTGGHRMLRAHVEGQNYTVDRASVLARLLALPSLTGLASTLSGSGLPFMTLRGDFTYGGGRINVERLLGFGEALGITANGWVDLDRDRLEMQGTVAPAYALNSILGHLPVVGQLLGGGSQGLFAANFRLSGSTSDPHVAVNPLSALAPGILRQLFAPLVGFPPAQPPQSAGATGPSPAPSTSQ